MKKKSGKPCLVDTSVLVYAHFVDSTHFKDSIRLFKNAKKGKESLAVTPQILLEFFAVITDHRRVTKPFGVQAAKAVERLISMPGVTVLPTSAESTVGWVSLARQYPVRQGHIFDYLIVATMLNYGIDTIYTYDEIHFRQFKHLKAIRPPRK